MASSKDPGGPLLGALLRLAHQRIAAALDDGFAAAGYPPLHGAATQPLWDHPEGMRLTELAALAGVTKQAMVGDGGGHDRGALRGARGRSRRWPRAPAAR